MKKVLTTLTARTYGLKPSWSEESLSNAFRSLGFKVKRVFRPVSGYNYFGLIEFEDIESLNLALQQKKIQLNLINSSNDAIHTCKVTIQPMKQSGYARKYYIEGTKEDVKADDKTIAIDTHQNQIKQKKKKLRLSTKKSDEINENERDPVELPIESVTNTNSNLCIDSSDTHHSNASEHQTLLSRDEFIKLDIFLYQLFEILINERVLDNLQICKQAWLKCLILNSTASNISELSRENIEVFKGLSELICRFISSIHSPIAAKRLIQIHKEIWDCMYNSTSDAINSIPSFIQLVKYPKEFENYIDSNMGMNMDRLTRMRNHAMTICRDIENIIKKSQLSSLYQNVQYFGSVRSQLANETSDIDIVIISKESQIEKLSPIAIQERSKLCEELEILEKKHFLDKSILLIYLELNEKFPIIINEENLDSKRALIEICKQNIKDIELLVSNINRQYMNFELHSFDRKQEILKLKNLHKLLRRYKYEVQPVIKHARVPMFQCFEPIHRTQCDILVDKFIGAENSDFINYIISLDESKKIYKYLKLVKTFTSRNDINDASKGYLSSYSWVVLSLHVLLRYGYLPATLLLPRGKCFKECFDVSYDKSLTQLPLKCQILLDNTDCYQLFYLFCCYLCDFPRDKSAITLRNYGELVSKDEIQDDLEAFCLAIEDPFERCNSVRLHDLGRCLRSFKHTNDTFKILQDARELFQSNTSNIHSNNDSNHSEIFFEQLFNLTKPMKFKKPRKKKVNKNQ